LPERKALHPTGGQRLFPERRVYRHTGSDREMWCHYFSKTGST
jgi:hypothetical protein